jgi:hypothetical protein
MLGRLGKGEESIPGEQGHSWQYLWWDRAEGKIQHTGRGGSQGTLYPSASHAQGKPKWGMHLCRFLLESQKFSRFQGAPANIVIIRGKGI